MKKSAMQKLATVGLVLSAVCSTARAADALDQFSLEVRGGGQYKATVYRGAKNLITVKTESCQFKELSEAEQKKTEFVLFHSTAVFDAMAILDGKATITASTPEGWPTGSWEYVTTKTSPLKDGDRKPETREFFKPIITVKAYGKPRVSDIFSVVLNHARKKAKAICGGS